MPRLPSFSRLRSNRRSKHLFAEGPVPRLLTVALADAASICSPRAPCLGDLASHGCARRRSKHLFAEGPVPRLPSFSRLRSNRRSKHLFAEGPVPRLPSFSRLRSNRRSKHLFAEGPVPRLPSFSRLREQTQQAPVRRGPRDLSSAT